MPLLNGIFYAEHAPKKDSTPLILIHGAGNNHLCWSKEWRGLGRVIALDLPAHGRSLGIARQSLRAYAQSVIQLLDDLGIPEAVFVGHSMGGGIAQTLALEFPTRARGLVLLATGAKLPVNPAILALTRQNYPESAALITKWSWSPDAPTELKEAALAQMLSLPAEVTYSDYLACDAFDLSHQLDQITTPTLLVYGKRDKMTPPAWGEFLAANLPNAQLKIIEGAGHMLILEQAAGITEAISFWLGEL